MDSTLKLILLNDKVNELDSYIKDLKLENETEIQFYNRISKIKVYDNKYNWLLYNYGLELSDTILPDEDLHLKIIDKLEMINIFDSILLFHTENDNNKLFVDCIYYLLDLFKNIKDMIDISEIYKLGIMLCIINVPFYIIKRYLDLFKSNIDDNNIIEYLLNGSLFNSTNISNVYQFSKLLNKKDKNLWYSILNYNYKTEFQLDSLFRFYNQNSQKTLKQLIKLNKLTINYVNQDMDINIDTLHRSVNLNIIKSLLKNNQLHLLNLYCDINEIDNYLQYVEVFEFIFEDEKLLISYLEYHKNTFDISIWISMFQDLKFKLNTYVTHYKLIRTYQILIDNCNCLEDLIYSVTSYDTTILNIISMLNKGHLLLDKIEKKLNKNIQYDLENNDNWCCILNCCRYSDYNTFKYILNRIENKMVYKRKSLFVYDILGCSLMNTDERIYKYILNNYQLFDDDMKEFLNQNIFDSLELLLKSNVRIPLKYKKQRLRDIIYIFRDEIENSYILETVIKYKYIYEKNVFYQFIKWIILELMTPLVNKEYDILISAFHYEFTEDNKDILFGLINEIILSDKIDIFSFYERSLFTNGWFNHLSQYLLSFIPNLNTLNLSQQQLITSSLINYWNRYYVNKNDIYSVLFILKQSNFKFDKMKFSINNKEFSILNYVIYISISINKNIIDVLLLLGVSLYSIDLKMVNHFNYRYILQKWYIIYNTINRYYKRKQKYYQSLFDKKYHKVKVELLYRPPKTITTHKSNNTVKINDKGGYQWLSNFNQFKNKLSNLSLLSPSKPNNPEHIDIFNLSVLLNKNDKIVITDKADGIKQTKLPSNVSPKLPFDLIDIECEYIKELDLYLVFNLNDIQYYLETGSNHPSNIINKIEWLRNIHQKYDTVSQKIDINNIIFNKENLEIEREKINEFIFYQREVLKNDKPLWYPKKHWIIYKKDLLEIYQDLLKNYQVSDLYQCDGWIMSNIENTIKLKYKPFHMLTLDLIYNSKTKLWKTREGFICNQVKFNQKDIIRYNRNNKYYINIWRCYWDYQTEYWIPKEIRYDKKYANSKSLTDMLTYQHKYHIDYIDSYKIVLQYNKLYYQKNKDNILDEDTSQFLKHQSQYSKEKILEIYQIQEDLSILDIGCGKSKCLKILDKYTKYVGLDIDICKLGLSKHIYQYSKNTEFLYFDINYSFNKEEQENRNNPMIGFQNIDLLYQNSFNYIMLHFSLHYGLFNNTLENLMSNILSFVSPQRYVIDIQFIDSDKWDLTNKKLIMNHSYIQNINQDEYQIYFEWCHHKPLIEKKISGKMLKNYLEINQLQYKELSKPYFNINNVWNSYYNMISYYRIYKL